MREREGWKGTLTPVKRRRLERRLEILETPAERIAYQHTVLCQTCLPYRNPGQERVWERRQGAVFLRVEAGAVRNPKAGGFVDVGLPYGSRPRLILAHLNREALLRHSPVVEVDHSLTAFVRRIQRANPNGKEIRRFTDQLSRLATALVRLAYDEPSERAYQIDAKIITAFELWSRADNGQRVVWPSEVRLSQDYFDSLTRHAVPLDERALAALANSALALDVYCWLAQRLHRIPKGKPQRITWAALHEQFGHGFSRLRKFRETFLDILALVHAQYSAARVEVDEGGIVLCHSPPPVAVRFIPAHKLLG